MTTQGAETDLVVSDPASQVGFLGDPAVPVVADPTKKARRKHRVTGKPRGGRRVYSLDPQIAENVHVYTPELASEILDRMAAGETVAEICRSRPGLPDPRTVRQWKYDVDGFGPAYARAQALQAEAWGDEIIELRNADDIDPQARRVRFDITRWVMSKTAPHIYGDKLTVAGDPSAPLHHVVHITEAIDELSEAELIWPRSGATC